MNSKHDSVAAPHTISTDLGKSLEWVLRNRDAYGFTGDDRNLRDYREAAKQFFDVHGNALAALTREAAPQASEIDDGGPYNGIDWRASYETAQAEIADLRRRLATPDSAIQSQQGATGGAESRQHRATYYESRHSVDAAMVDRATVAFVACDRPLIADGIRAALEAALAHPQAAGSAPGEAMQPQRSHGSMMTPEWIRNGPQPTNSAGSVASGAGDAWIELSDTPYGRGYTTSLDPLTMPVGRYYTATAAGSAPVGDAKDAVAWLIAGTERNGVRFRTVHLHNAIADYRDIDPDATVTPLYAGDAKP